MNERPKTLIYAEDLAAVERRIVAALPDIVDALIERAKTGDLKAATYLCDRILGRAAGSKVPPANDKTAPYTEATFQVEEDERRSRETLFRRLFPTGARGGA